MRIIPSSQLLPNWFRKVFKLLWPHQNRSLFNSGTSDTVRERKKKKKRNFTQSSATKSPLSLFYLCAVGGDSLGGKRSGTPACVICAYGFGEREAAVPAMSGSLSARSERTFPRGVRWEGAHGSRPASRAGFPLCRLQVCAEHSALPSSRRTADLTWKHFHLCGFPLTRTARLGRIPAPDLQRSGETRAQGARLFSTGIGP